MGKISFGLIALSESEKELSSQKEARWDGKSHFRSLGVGFIGKTGVNGKGFLVNWKGFFDKTEEKREY